ncbi:MAG: MFS transporter [Pseudomonadota bacterium]|nr:MFS transporter [Gammaproteobacteria bacterium]MBU1558184.1 MFS transporter [Gammaproteobacteria bacterium]MBU1926779.1 MFS transporter [Gammaproteobacteria bacterium]MBU2545788.1 MFS transporter [Gammaproteobacteria bacterium]
MTQQLKKYSFLPWIIWGLSALFYFYEFLLQVSPNVIAEDLMREFHMDGAALGYCGALYFWSYALMQIPVGILLDRFGSRKWLTIAAFVCALGSFGFASSSSIIAADLSRTLMGFGSAFAAVGCLNLAARWFSSKHFALLTGLMVTIGMLGAAFGEEPFALVIGTMGWRHALFALGWIGLFLSALMWLVIRDYPKGKHPRISPTKAPLWEGLRRVISNRQSWIAAIYGGLMFAPTPILGALWGTSFIEHSYHFSHTTAAGMSSAIFIGWIIGCPFFGWLSDHFCLRKPPMYIASVGALISALLFIYLPIWSPLVLAVLLAFFGFISSGFAPAFSIVREINPHRYSATSLGFMNMANTLGAAAAQPAIGIILDTLWTGTMNNGARIYSVHQYQIALSAIPIMILLSLFLLPFIRETRCVGYEENHA